MNIAIIGCGFIGRKRAAALDGHKLTVCCDINLQAAQALAKEHPEAEAISDWQEAVLRPGISLVVVATTHDLLAPVAQAAAQAGKHVLIEKPGARRAAELDAVAAAASEKGVTVRVGFNHRYHPALRKAHEMIRAGSLGDLMFVRGRYGHGGRAGYDKEWRAKPEISGGGELIDQGLHLIDLSRWLLGEEFTRVQGAVTTSFWDMPVEDNGFLILETATKRVAFLHASWTEWKNTFSLEIYGKKAKLEINGLGGSYGPERLTRWENILGKASTPEVWEFPGPDQSWQLEFAAFLADIDAGRPSKPGIEDAQRALEVIEQVYERKDL